MVFFMRGDWGIHGLVHCFVCDRDEKGASERMSEYTKRRWICV